MLETSWARKFLNALTEDDKGRLKLKISTNLKKIDVAVVCTGSDYEPPMKANLDGALHGRDRRKDMLLAARQLEKSDSVLVIGGGAVGVELAAEIAAERTKQGRPVGVTLVNGMPGLLPGLPPSVGAAAEEWLTSHGVEIVPSELVLEGPEGFIPRPGRWESPLASQRSSPSASDSFGKEEETAEETAEGEGEEGGKWDDVDGSECVRRRTARERLPSVEWHEPSVNLSSGGAGVYKTDKGREIEVDTAFKAVGFTFNAVPMRVGADGDPAEHVADTGATKKGPMPCERSLLAGEVGGAPVFVAGDVAGDPAGGMKLAHAAEMQASIVADAIRTVARTYAGEEAPGPLPRYPETLVGAPNPPRVMIVSLGPDEGLLLFNGLVLSDPIGRRIAAFLKWFIEVTKLLQSGRNPLGSLVWALGDAVANILTATLLPGPDPSAKPVFPTPAPKQGETAKAKTK